MTNKLKGEVEVTATATEVARIRRKLLRPSGYCHLVEGVSTFKVDEMADDMRSLILSFNTVHAALQAVGEEKD